MALVLGLEVVEVPGDGNCFLHAARFSLLQPHGWNYDLVPTHEVMRAQVCSFMKEKSEILDGNGMHLDDIRLAYCDHITIPPGGVILEPPRLSFYDSWDQWMSEMERPNAYADQLFAHALSYVYGVCIRLLCDGIP